MMKKLKKVLLVILAAVTLPIFKVSVSNADNLFVTSAKSAYLADYNTDTVIFKQDEEKRLPIASMTKIMLLNLVFDEVETGNLSLSDEIVVSKTASAMGGSQVFLQAEGAYTVSDLVKSVIVASANDASVALAEKICGTEAAFVNKMNQTAKDWGLKNTLFSNCTGLPKPTQYSCAKDVAFMLKQLLKHDDYYKYSNIWLDEIVHPDGTKTTITNTNKLSRFYDGCDGGKTGFTSESKFCLAATAKRNNTRLICVVIGEESSEKRFKEASDMFNVGFSNYETTVAVDANKPLNKVLVKGSYLEYIDAYPKNDLTVFQKIGEKVNYDVTKKLSDDIKAPLKKGDKVGEVTIFVDGVEYQKTDLVVNCDVYVQSYGESFDKIAKNW